MTPASYKILFAIRSFYTHESLSSVQPYHFQADLIWCDAAFNASLIWPENNSQTDNTYNETGRLRYLRWS